MEWCLSGRRRKGSRRNSWMQEVTTGMISRGISLHGMHRQGKMEREKIRTLDPEICENIGTV